MRILLDLSNLSVGGGIQVACSFVRYIGSHPSHTFYVAASHKLALSFGLSQEEDLSFKMVVVTTNQKTLLPGSRSLRQIRSIENNFRPDIVFTLFGPAYWKSKSHHLVGFARPHYILHDSPFFSIISWQTRLYFFALETVHNYLFRRNSDYLFVENESMLPALTKKYKKKVYYIPNTFHQAFENIDQTFAGEADSIFRLLTVSSNYLHKNLDIIPKVISSLVEMYPEFQFEFILTIDSLTNEDAKTAKHIKFIGAVSIDDCPKLYKSSHAMFLPTLLECFSASYVESMKAGRPILTSDLPFAKSICGDAAVYFDPLAPGEIAQKIYELANNDHLYSSIVAKGNRRVKSFGTPEDRFNSFIKLFQNIS